MIGSEFVCQHKKLKMKIIGLFPLTGNGGIASWTKKFTKTFPDEKYQFSFVNVSPSTPRAGGLSETMLVRSLTGFTSMFRILREVKHVLKSDKYDILHTTTSGNIGSLRDYRVAKLCKMFGVKSIMHCRYGCITEDIQSKSIIGWLLRRAMTEFDQIWVLDSRSYNTLKGIEGLKDKVYLTPNSIDVTEEMNPAPKVYSRVAFIGNLYPTKGLYELVEACMRTDVRLDIIGPGADDVKAQVKKLAGDKLDKTVFIHGKLPNPEAIKFMHDVDIVALPTYYPWEAFPISIIEAMSLTKMVISCPRAAVKDMLTDLDGHPCGMLVPPKSSDAIVEAINWCQTHKEEADMMCQKAYEKVKTCYSKEVVYDLYRSLYRKLV